MRQPLEDRVGEGNDGRGRFTHAARTGRHCEYADAIDRLVKAVKKKTWVVSVVSPLDVGTENQISKDKTAAYATMGLNGDDLGNETLSKLPLVMTIVLVLSFCYLLLVFRSLLIPVKAVLMRLLATFAAFGLTAWVFADGHLESVLGFTSVGFVRTFLPIMVFAVLFGLSMDYEVFLVGRMQEGWLTTGDKDQSVGAGVVHTARVITAAAAIMAAVFGCFIVADVLELKEFGFALAVAVVLDATLTRLLIVPAVMKVAGGKADSWLPGFLKRILPKVNVE